MSLVIKPNPKLYSEITAKTKRALIMTGEWVVADIKEAQVIPKMRGTLEKTLEPLDVSEIESMRIKIHSNTPYAVRLYNHPEYHFHREPWSITHRDGRVESFEGNPNARAEWFQPWLKGKRVATMNKVFKRYLE